MDTENGNTNGRDPVTGRFARGWKGGGRPKGRKTKVVTTDDVVIEHALSRDPTDPENRKRLETVLDRLACDRPAEYLRLVLRLVRQAEQW